jgi:hypothetical protein
MSKIHAEWLIFNAEAQRRRGWVDASFTIEWYFIHRKKTVVTFTFFYRASGFEARIKPQCFHN